LRSLDSFLHPHCDLMAFVALPAVCCIGVGVTAAVCLMDDEDDVEYSVLRQQARQQRIAAGALKPVNARTVTINATGGRMGLTLANVAMGYGVKVTNVQPNDLAAANGIREGDWILSINGTDIERHDEAVQLISFAHENNVTLVLAVMSPRSITIDVARKPHLGVALTNDAKGTLLESKPRRYKATLCALASADAAGSIGARSERGVLIADLNPEDFIAQSGFCVGDVITSVNNQYVRSHEAVLGELKKQRWFNKRKPRFVSLTVMTSTSQAAMTSRAPAGTPTRPVMSPPLK